MAIVTVAERRARELARLTTAVTTVTRALAGYARANSVRFVIFGSFARGDFDVSSDLDLMVEGPQEHLRSARAFAETICERDGLRHDVYLVSEVSERLMSRIRRDGRAVA